MTGALILSLLGSAVLSAGVAGLLVGTSLVGAFKWR